jgi:hypothetical protein
MARYFETAKTIVQRHGGTVEKFIGDAVMAVFGVPAVHEDDALRAVRAASELLDGLVPLNVELEEAYGTRLELRMGVNTGEVVTGTEERLATGDAVNLSARLEQAAQPGEVLLGEETYRLVRDAVEAEPAPPVEAKGKAEPVVASASCRCRTRLPQWPVGTARRWSAVRGNASCSRTPSRASPASAPATSSPCSVQRVWASRAWSRSSSGPWTRRPSSAAGASPTARGSATGR